MATWAVWVWRQGPSTGAIVAGHVGVLRQARGFCRVGNQGGVRVQRLRHLVADDVHQALKHRLDVDVLLG